MRYTTPVRGASLVALLAAAPAVAQVPSVVTEMPVTHSLVAMVMGDLAEPVLLLDRGADAHDFALRPSQAQAVAGAGLVVWMGPQMTQWMERAVSALSGGADLRLLAVEGTFLQPFPQSRLTGLEGGHAGHDHGHSHGHSSDHTEDHGDDHTEGHAHGHAEGHAHGHADAHADGHADGHAHGHEHAHDHGHDHGQQHGHAERHAHGHADNHGGNHAADDMDPHAWLDPHNAGIWLSAIAEKLAELDPANAETYRANASAARAMVEDLDAEIAAILAPVGDAGLVVYHDAYGYFAGHFGVNVLGSVALGDAAAPGAARLREIRATLEGAGAVCAFPEVNHSDAFVALATEGSSLRIGAPLDPEGSALEPGAALYGDLLRGLAQSIADCVTAG